MKRILTTLKEKWPEYLLEIFVLIIGIYGAFAVDNWNEERKERKSEILVLENLKKELQSNFVQWDYIFGRHKVRMQSAKSILDENVYEMSSERIDLLMDSVLYNWTYNPNLGVYKSVINTGKLDLITNEALRTRIAGFGDRLEDFQEDEFNAATYSRGKLEPFVIKNYPTNLGFDRTEEEKKTAKDIRRIITSQEYRNHMKMLIAYLQSVVIGEGPLITDEYETLTSIIDEELKILKK